MVDVRLKESDVDTRFEPLHSESTLCKFGSRSVYFDPGAEGALMERERTAAMFAMSAQDSIRWLFFNVGLALFPIWSTYMVVTVFREAPTWQRLLKEGELFVFACTLSSAAMGTAFFERDVRLTMIMFASCGLILVLIVSGGLFFATVQARLTETTMPNERLLVKISIICALAASGLSYLVNSAESIR